MDHINLKVAEIRDKIYQDISDSQLPISIIYYLLENMTKQIQMLYHQQVQRELNEQNDNKDVQ